jgi:hypothetical protein
MQPQEPAMEASLQAYLDCVEEMESAVSGLSEADLNLNAGAGWTIRQMVHHVADGDDIWKNCILLILGNAGAEFHLSWYWTIPQDEWAVHWAYHQRDIRDSLARFCVNRKMIVDLLRLRPDAWHSFAVVHWPGDAQATHITIEEVVKLQTLHPHGHCSEIMMIRQQQN